MAAPAPLRGARAQEAAVLAACRIADFDVLVWLGSGSSADGFLVRCVAAGHPFPHKVYVVKAAKNYAALSERALQVRFETELHTLRRLGPHPGIIRLRAHFVDVYPPAYFTLLTASDQEIMTNGMYGALYTVFSVFDYHPQTLAEQLRELRAAGPCVFPLAEVVPMARQLFEVAQFLRDAGVLHRDIKPTHVMVKEDGSVCLAGFDTSLVLPRPPVCDPVACVLPVCLLCAPLCGAGCGHGAVHEFGPAA